ncbi:hypothetical protein PG984_009827 [Apiospora sp. TS-2023a]
MFTKFRQLPPELRLLIWEEAVREDHRDRIVPLAQDTKCVMLMNSILGTHSGVFLACYEARQAALTVYNVALPVGIFSIFLGQSLAQQTYGHQTGGFVQRGTVRVSLRHDIFYVSSYAIDYLREKLSVFEYADFVTRVPRMIMGGIGANANKAPRYKTIALTSAQRARIERVLEVHDVTTQYLNLRATQGLPVQHAFTAAGLPALRECFHVDNPFTTGGIRRPNRFLNHLTQGYTSAQLMTWLNPVVCPM